ncbi:Nin one binding (NOB1) Zn-ribbon-like [Ostreococcus tauri]|uniref:Nin one binding (NOB1) Zn-ribbon-like n=1 Tax=Ostreococcus tauri TaxID=70448 RepID=A0A090M2R8_OSTTA|nr:Nin one binding (NOB1) Zn-ribbon-like [Ostreococcus tauri]CEF98496.1 Nin one binding (NOB1) Zn-ribbon-like [Ostreococcus tauri]|eukprot:XP_022839295.1 Nin one binding (NOB1) Zn-ribbon-like [Ostreococcus tauri]
MSSPWAKIVRDDPEPRAVDQDEARRAAAAARTLDEIIRSPTHRKAIVDANAIFKGAIGSFIDPETTLVTIAEVQEEIRDERARRVAGAMALTTREPTEEAIEAVKTFAAKTGDLQALSRVDLKLIALAYDVERMCHGVEHLRTEPAPPRTTGKKASANEKRPGWDFVPNADDWAELDEMNDAHEQAEREMRAKMASVALSEEAEKKTETAADRERREDEERRARERAETAAETAAGQSHIEKDDGDDDGWERAVCRTTRVRRQKREERARWEAEQAAAEAEVSREQNEDDDGSARAEELEDVSKRAVDFFTSRGELEEGAEEEVDDEDEDYDEVELESCVSSITADFAMQNVILQMGLKLIAPDGMRIEQLRRWVLRCHACNEISRDLSRIFCPKCGNQTMQKVEHTVTRDGVEQFGVRKKFVLRGSKYSLPLPKGGRREKKIILREDQLMSVRLTKKQIGEDVFAAEYNEESYADDKRFASQKTAFEVAGDVRRNPNERRHVATNRRRK